MKEIQLTQGKVTIVDDDMYDYLNQWKWYYNGRYAQRQQWMGNGKEKNIHMSRLIMNAPDDMQVDHINHDKLDNRRSNLRICTGSQNCANTRKHSTNISGIKGVSWDKINNKWVARMSYQRKYINLGRYTNLDDAAEAYANGAKKYFGEFAYVERE